MPSRRYLKNGYSFSFPYLNNRFIVDIDGLGSLGFRNISGLGIKQDTYKFREGGNNFTEIKLPGQFSFEPIVLTKGIADDKAIWNWIYACTQIETNYVIKNLYKRNLSISLLDKEKKEVRRWDVFGAIPVEYKVENFNAEESNILIESLTIEHHGFEESNSLLTRI